MARTFLKFRVTPITRKRLARFRKNRLSHACFWLLVVLYSLSLGSELICNDRPLFVRYQGQSYFPALKFYPENTFVTDGKKTRPDYKKIRNLPEFADNPKNFMIFAPVPFGPFESVDPKSIQPENEVTVHLFAQPSMGRINVNPDFSVRRSQGGGEFFGLPDSGLRGMDLSQFLEISPDLQNALNIRLNNQAAPPMEARVINKANNRFLSISLSTYTPRPTPPASVRLTINDTLDDNLAPREMELVFDQNAELEMDLAGIWKKLTDQNRRDLVALAAQGLETSLEPGHMELLNLRYRVQTAKNQVRFPYPPCPGHWMGIDGAGRDVFARILYGLRTSMTFGILLVAVTMLLGTLIGALQGYYSGLVDITAQRVIEIWSAIPFLYVMILLGSVYGRGFVLLLAVYGVFNWIGISYYMRGEFLRLRKQPFVEAAQCLGMPTRRILFAHILPNALVPIITFFPFSLVAAIGSLAALDYLGFGLPPPTPSWGELLSQAQNFRWAWWLILYPSLALFLVMLLGVFIGEGIRNAFDPKQYARLR